MGIPEEQQEPGQSLGISNFHLFCYLCNLLIYQLVEPESNFTHTAVPPLIVSIKLSNLDVGALFWASREPTFGINQFESYESREINIMAEAWGVERGVNEEN
jgi:hypothetical protein